MSYIETPIHYIIKNEYTISSPLTVDDINHFKEKKLGLDELSFTLDLKNLDEQSWHTDSQEDIDTLMQLYNDSLREFSDDNDDDEDFIVELTVTYQKSKQEFNIYSPSIYIKELESRTFSQLYKIFNSYAKNSSPTPIHMHDNFEFQTTLFNSASKDTVHRNKIIENWDMFTSIIGFDEEPLLLPTDFINSSRIVTIKKEFDLFLNLFKKISSMLSLFFLVDSVVVKDDKIKIKISAQKKLSIEFNFKDITVQNTETISKIFNWVYMDESTFLADDKIVFAKDQLARKLFINDNKFLHIDKTIYPSILSMHRIYLKENAQQYIDTTNTVAELIRKIAIQQKEIQSSLVNALKNSSNIFLGLFITLLVFNTIASGKSLVFNYQNFYLTIIFAVISLIGLGVANYQVHKDLKDVENQFNNTKEIYSGMFHIEDLENLFHEKYILDLKKSIRSTQKVYSIIWILEVILVVVLISIFTFTCWLNF